ncbi:MAG TPA: FAD-binding oxidoreductase [Streptosporangiaceae bacterium]
MTAADMAAALGGSGAVVGDASPADAVAGVAPSYVAFPGSVSEAAGVMREATAQRMAVVPRGSGSRISWGVPPTRCDLVADMTQMDRVLEHAAGDLVVRVEAGVTLASLADVLAKAGQRLVLEGPPSATVGGVVATGTAGPLRLRYGTPRDVLIGITVVRADGHVAHSGGRVVKNVAGYDIGKLFAGSHGTLGLITEATFRLHPIAPARSYVTAEYGDAAPAAEAALSAAASSLVASAVEADRAGPGAPVRVGVLLEGTAPGVAERAARMIELLGADAQASESAPRWWGQRGEAAVPSAGTLIQITFWAGKLRPVLEMIDMVAADARVTPAVGGSAGAGMLYASLDGGEDAGQVATFVRALRAATGTGGPARGSVVVLTAPAAVREAVDLWGPVPALELMRAVKAQFDPDHRMAPGRFAGGI